MGLGAGPPQQPRRPRGGALTFYAAALLLHGGGVLTLGSTSPSRARTLHTCSHTAAPTTPRVPHARSCARGEGMAFASASNDAAAHPAAPGPSEACARHARPASCVLSSLQRAPGAARETRNGAVADICPGYCAAEMPGRSPSDGGCMNATAPGNARRTNASQIAIPDMPASALHLSRIPLNGAFAVDVPLKRISASPRSKWRTGALQNDRGRRTLAFRGSSTTRAAEPASSPHAQSSARCGEELSDGDGGQPQHKSCTNDFSLKVTRQLPHLADVRFGPFEKEAPRLLPRNERRGGV